MANIGNHLETLGNYLSPAGDMITNSWNTALQTLSNIGAPKLDPTKIFEALIPSATPLFERTVIMGASGSYKSSLSFPLLNAMMKADMPWVKYGLVFAAGVGATYLLYSAHQKKVTLLRNKIFELESNKITDAQASTSENTAMLNALTTQLSRMGDILKQNVKDLHQLKTDIHLLTLHPIVEGEALAFESPKLIFKNWQEAEPEHRWSCDKSSTIGFHCGNTSSFEGKMKFVGFKLTDSHSVRAYLNDRKLDHFKIGEEFTFDKKFLNANGVNRLRFELPNAAEPGSEDPRILSLAIKNLTIS